MGRIIITATGSAYRLNLLFQNVGGPGDLGSVEAHGCQGHVGTCGTPGRGERALHPFEVEVKERRTKNEE